ncbi:protein Aster-A isoform X4 [Polypterus senegalus]|uniref:protein Aster-A isoform X4 n=1 Tax=Polypterus senegalus TaxID=55291 RepID=UPI001966B4A4|nr:protein Aster-A isoform X4 [Polypterus senegalus]
MAKPLSIPSLTILPPASDNEAWSRSSTPTFKKRRKAKLVEQGASAGSEMEHAITQAAAVLRPPTIEITPSSDEDVQRWSNCSTPSASPRRRRFLLKKWLRRGYRNHATESDSCSTASNSPRSTPSSSPAVRKRLLPSGSSSRSCDGESSSITMVEKGSDSSSEKGSATPPVQPPGSSNSTPSSYPLSARNFARNAKKMQSWYNQVLSPTYKQRNEDFRKLFKKLPDTERLIVDYSCALQKDILLQGRLYLSENWICFYSNIFRWETTITIQLKDVTSLTKEKTAKLIPNAIQICTDQDKHFFTSFGARDRSYLLIFRLWQNALLEKPLSPKELWHIVHQCYGTELGLTSEDEDYVSPTDQIIPVDDAVPELLELRSEHSPRPSMDLKLDASPLANCCVNNRSMTSVESSDGGPSFLDDPEPRPESQLDGLPNQILSPASEREAVGILYSLDLINDDDIPTDMSNSSDTQDEVEVEAICTDLAGRLHINVVYHIGVDKLFELLFTDPHFIQDLFKQRNMTELAVNEWQQDNSGSSSRIISYNIGINKPVGPKTAPSIETQTLCRGSEKGKCYVIDAEVVMQGIPYQDYFYTVHRYCLTSVTRSKCRLRVSSDIRYKKHPWNLVKSFIEKNTWSGIEDYFRHLELKVSKVEALLKPEVAGSETPSKLPSLRRRKRNPSRKSHHVDGLGSLGALADKERPPRAGLGAASSFLKHAERFGGSHGISTVLLIVSFILVVLVVLNMLLFYKLWSLERAAHTLETLHTFALSDGKLPQTVTEWAHILELQKEFHNAEVRKWKQILKASVRLLDEMKFSLEKLHKGILTMEAPLTSENNQEDPFA